jgi:hypothetical protein
LGPLAVWIDLVVAYRARAPFYVPVSLGVYLGILAAVFVVSMEAETFVL